MTIEEIVSYTIHTPHNIDPNILRQIIQNYEAQNIDNIIESYFYEILNTQFGTEK